MTGDEAKAILQQIGWGSEKTLFMSFRFSPEQFEHFSRAYFHVTIERTPEEFVSDLHQTFITEQGKRSEKV